MGIILKKKKTNWEPKSRVNLTLKDKIRKKKTQFCFKETQVNLSQLTKLSMQVMHAIKFNKFFFIP